MRPGYGNRGTPRLVYYVLARANSDEGSLFKNVVITRLENCYNTKHTFLMADNPQSNGSVEVACCKVLRGVRALLSEMNIGPASWPRLLSMARSMLNR